MTSHPEPPYDQLKKLFHEPARLAILTTLLDAPRGIPFTRLRDACQLTDGNLSRHLKMLENAGVAVIEKTFVGVKPRTTIFLSQTGQQRFLDYLEALENVLATASKRLERYQEEERADPSTRARTAEA